MKGGRDKEKRPGGRGGEPGWRKKNLPLFPKHKYQILDGNYENYEVAPISRPGWISFSFVLLYVFFPAIQGKGGIGLTKYMLVGDIGIGWHRGIASASAYQRVSGGCSIFVWSSNPVQYIPPIPPLPPVDHNRHHDHDHHYHANDVTSVCLSGRASDYCQRSSDQKTACPTTN